MCGRGRPHDSRSGDRRYYFVRGGPLAPVGDFYWADDDENLGNLGVRRRTTNS